MNIGWFATPEDKAYVHKMNALIGQHSVKVAWAPQEYMSTILAKTKALNFDAIICTCPETLVSLLNTQHDFRHPLDKRGLKKKLSLNDYAGSCFAISKEQTGLDHDTQVLILNPPAQLVTVPSAPHVFKRFISKLLSPDSWFPQTKFTWEVWRPEKSETLFALLESAVIMSVDIETFRDDPLRRIHCVGYGVLLPDGRTHSVVVPFNSMIAHDFVHQINTCKVPKLMQNGLYDNLYFARFGVPCYNYLHDTQHMFHSWFSELPKRLDFITAYCVREVRYWKDDSAGSEFELFEYNAKDCWATLTTYLSMLRIKDKWVLDNYLIEFPLVFPCHHVEMDGIRVDLAVFRKNKAAIEVRLDLVKRQLALWFGANFNPNSHVQVKALIKMLTGKEAESSDDKTVQAVSFLHPFNRRVLKLVTEYRELTKLLGTYYVEDKFWHERLYYKLNPAGTDTGRLASMESSFWCGLQIQNIPGDPAAGVKDWLIADEGWEMAEADYAQSEARCVGYMSGCKNLIDLVESEKDYHSWNAQSFFGVPYEEIWDITVNKTKNKKLRDLSKRTNHGANYNMGDAVMVDTVGPEKMEEARVLLKLPKTWSHRQIAGHLLAAYERTYPEVKRDFYDWLKRTVSLTKKLVSPLGWTRYFFNDPTKSKPALNAVVAHGPQNLSVGIINEKFYSIWRRTVYGDLHGKVRLKAQIHDSIFFCYKGLEAAEEVRKSMENPKQITDIKGVTRTLLIPPDLSAGQTVWAKLK